MHLISCILLLNCSSFIKNMVLFENCWVVFFGFCCVCDAVVDDVSFVALAFLCLVIAACEIITLASMYILDYNK